MLLTAGCSFVWGDELEGFDNDPPTHWEYTFTHLLAQKLGMDYVNLGLCGSCNDRIFRDVIDHLHDPEKENPTHMVILWSAWQRSEIVEEMPPERAANIGLGRPLDHTQFSPLRIDVLNKGPRRELLREYYGNYYDSKTDISHGISKMKAMEVLCEGLGIKLIQGVFHGRNWQNILKVLTNTPSRPDTDDRNIAEYVPEFANWLKRSVNSLKDTSRVGLGKHVDLHKIGVKLDDLKPYHHPGEKTQVVFADFLFDQFEKEFD
jgi:hypothetical protein